MNNNWQQCCMVQLYENHVPKTIAVLPTQTVPRLSECNKKAGVVAIQLLSISVIVLYTAECEEQHPTNCASSHGISCKFVGIITSECPRPCQITDRTETCWRLVPNWYALYLQLLESPHNPFVIKRERETHLGQATHLPRNACKLCSLAEVNHLAFC